MDFSDCDSIGDIQLKQYLLQMTSIFPEDELLYHYTSPQGLSGILKKEEIELRFTKCDCLNDITEGNSIVDFYKSTCTKLLSIKRIDQGYYDSIINLLPTNELPFIYDAKPLQLIDGIPVKDSCFSEYVSYVFCFSKLSNSLPLWNYYLKNGCYEGYNLGFHPEKLKESFHYHPKMNFHSEFIVVEYDDDEKDDILLDFIEALYRFRYTDDIHLSKTKVAISQELFKWRYAFKPEYFSHEKEVRILIHVPLNENKTALALFVKPQLRFSDEIGIPKYIFTSLTDKKALNEITISPLFIDKGQELLLSQLKSKEYEVNVNISNIPIRF